MDRAHGTERLADASFLEELLRGRRTLVLSFGDPAPARHLASRLSPSLVVAVEPAMDGRIPEPDRSADAVIALGGFQDPKTVDRLIEEARRLLAPGGLFAASWIEPSRQTLEAWAPDAGAGPSLSPGEATRRLGSSFPFVSVVARHPYLGFQYVTGVDNGGAVPLDTSLTAAGSERPTGYMAIAAEASLPVGDLLVQVPYDRAVERVNRWLESARSTAPASPSSPPAGNQRITQAVARPRDGGNELERLRSEVSGLRDRAQVAVEESDRARGEARGSRERASLLDAEVAKLRARLRGAPDEETAELKDSLAERLRERDLARKDAEGAAAEAARALEAAARYEREVDFLTERVDALEREIAQAHQDAERAIGQAREERENAVRELEALRAESEPLRKAAGAGAELEKRVSDLQRRSEQTLKRLEDSQRRLSELEEAKSAAERSAEDAWRRMKEVQAAEPAADLVPASDLAAVQAALAVAIARAELAESERRRTSEEAEAAREAAQRAEAAAAQPVAAPQATEETAELERTLSALREELDAVRTRADQAESRATSAQRVAEGARDALEAAQARLAASDTDGLKSLLHQRETALQAVRDRVESAEARAARFETEGAEAAERLRRSETAMAEREAELRKALSALDGLEAKGAREKELIAELKGEVARLTEALSSARADLAAASDRPATGASIDSGDPDEAASAVAKAQVESARAHAEADALRERLVKAEAELEEAAGGSAKLAAREEEREHRIAELEAKLLAQRSHGESTSEMERRAVAMSQKLAMLEAELERANDDVKQATAEARKYRALAEAIDPPSNRPAKA